MTPRRIVALLFNGVNAVDITGPTEVFSQAHRAHANNAAYDLDFVATEAKITTSSGLSLTRSATLTNGPIDTLIIPGGAGVRDACRDERLVAWVRSAARRSRRVTSVCTGAFLLARAGLLDGRRATTHWTACAALARTHPTVVVDPDPIFVRDGNVYTSAGVTAGIDLALALVEEDLGAQAALDVARAMVLFVRRPGGQAQFSAGLAGQAAELPRLRELQDWMREHPERDQSVAALAERCFMSPRNFARVFVREVGITPASYVESLRLERARILLETTDLQLEEVARRCGFGTVETLRRTFGRRLRATPTDYRARFARSADNVISIRRSASR